MYVDFQQMVKEDMVIILHLHYWHLKLLNYQEIHQSSKINFKYVNTWKPKRLVVNTGRWWNDNISEDDPGVVSLILGDIIN